MFYLLTEILNQLQYDRSKNGFNSRQYIHKTLESYEGSSHSIWLHAKVEGVINSFIKTKSTIHGLSQTLCEREWSHITSVSEDLL